MVVVASTWESRDLPVLVAAVELCDESDTGTASETAIQDRTGFDSRTVQRALVALAHEDPPLFGQVGEHDFGIHTVAYPTGHARRIVGSWPTPESLAERIVDGLEEAADKEPDEDKRGRLRRAASSVRDVGRELFVDVVAESIKRGMYGS